MTDVVDQNTRSRMMAGIRGANTRPELILRRGLHAAGFRYGLHAVKLPGKPDLVLPRRRAVIFVHGCFWHRHQGCFWCSTPASRQDFWMAKFKANVERDYRNSNLLHSAGWRVGVIWECALKVQPETTIERAGEWLHSDACTFETIVFRSTNPAASQQSTPPG